MRDDLSVSQKDIFDIPPPSRELHPSRILTEVMGRTFLFHIRKRCPHPDCWSDPDLEVSCSGHLKTSFCHRAVESSSSSVLYSPGTVKHKRSLSLWEATPECVEAYFHWILVMVTHIHRMYVHTDGTNHSLSRPVSVHQLLHESRSDPVIEVLKKRFGGQIWDDQLTLTIHGLHRDPNGHHDLDPDPSRVKMPDPVQPGFACELCFVSLVQEGTLRPPKAFLELREKEGY